MISFEYLSIADQISSAMAFKTLCREMLTMCKAKTEWLNVPKAPLSLVNFWHGKKIRECKDF